tara:strand:+ start:1287 stop:1940 length:654 start_codon:yes stop_codon:yes gene_type:complete
MALFVATLKSNLKLDLKRSLQYLVTPSFFIIIATLFPLAIGSDMEILQLIGPGILVLSALLASLLPLSRIYALDYTDGTLDLVHFSHDPFAMYALGKIAAHWLTTALPLMIVAPFIALSYDLQTPLTTLWLALLPVTMLFTLIGNVTAALGTFAKNTSAALNALLVTPLYIPILIFGSASLGQPDSTAPLLFLWAGLSIALPTAPLLTAGILKGLRD